MEALPLRVGRWVGGWVGEWGCRECGFRGAGWGWKIGGGDVIVSRIGGKRNEVSRSLNVFLSSRRDIEREAGRLD